MKGCSRKSSDRCATGRTRPPSQTLNERLLPKEQRRWRIEAVNVLARSPSMKGYSRKSSDRILSTVSTAAMIPSMKGCSRKSSDEQQSGALCSYAPSLNERLLPKEQRRSDQHASKRLIHVPSMKGCSRKSSDFVPSLFARPLSRPLNERLLPKEQRLALQIHIGGIRPPSMKGCSRKSSDSPPVMPRMRCLVRPSMKGCSRKSSDPLG